MNAMTGALCILLGWTATVGSQTTAQNQTNQNAAHGSIAGRVTIDGEGAQDLVVMLSTADRRSNPKLQASTKTDAEGRFQLADVPTGRYVISAFAPAHTDDSISPLQVTVSDGQHVEGVEIKLALGGVITGRLLSADGQPVEGESVEAVTEDKFGNVGWLQRRRFITSDDRGVYRIYGLAPGRYLLRAGTDIEHTSGMASRKVQPLTFHPGVTDRTKAVLVKVEYGSEVRDIDIVFGKPQTLFEASGRVVEAETGRPVATARLRYKKIRQDGSSEAGGGITDGQGYFKVGGLGPGRFSVCADVEGTNSYCEPAEFEIKDRDVTDLKIKLQKGATISGVVQPGEEVDRHTLSKLYVGAVSTIAGSDKSGPRFSRFASVSPDGSFQVLGLPGGEMSILLHVPNDLQGLAISGIDHPMVQLTAREGSPPEGTLSLKPGDQISGIRIVVKRLTGGIRGAVKLSSGNLPPGAEFSVTVWHPVGTTGSYGRGVEVDPNGKFEIKGLKPGIYRLTANMTLLNQSRRPRSSMSVEKTLSVSDKVEEIELVIDASKSEKEPQKESGGMGEWGSGRMGEWGNGISHSPTLPSPTLPFSHSSLLFIPQRFNWIYFRSPPRGDVTCEERNSRQHHGYCQVSQRIGRAHAEQ